VLTIKKAEITEKSLLTSLSQKGETQKALLKLRKSGSLSAVFVGVRRTTSPQGRRDDSKASTKPKRG
jgi:hypothetical protein